MKNQWFAKLALLFVLALAACQPVQAMPVAQGSADATECTLATIKGRYIFASSGPLAPPALGVTEATPATSTGFHIFNGDGTGKDIVTLRINGKTVLDKVEVPLKYTVNADCTGEYTVEIPDGPVFEMFIAPNGSQIATVSTNDGNYVSSIDPRVSK